MARVRAAVARAVVEMAMRVAGRMGMGVVDVYCNNLYMHCFLPVAYYDRYPHR